MLRREGAGNSEPYILKPLPRNDMQSPMCLQNPCQRKEGRDAAYSIQKHVNNRKAYKVRGARTFLTTWDV